MASSHDAEASSAPALPRSERKRRRSIGLMSDWGSYFDFSASALEVYPAASHAFHFSMALGLPSQPPSAGFTNVPLASFAHPRPPAGRPSFIGQYETVTMAPGSKVLPVIPRVSSDCGAEPSKLHNVWVPSAFLTFRYSHECGALNCQRATVPVATFSTLLSNIANEW